MTIETGDGTGTTVELHVPGAQPLASSSPKTTQGIRVAVREALENGGCEVVGEAESAYAAVDART